MAPRFVTLSIPADLLTSLPTSHSLAEWMSVWADRAAAGSDAAEEAEELLAIGMVIQYVLGISPADVLSVVDQAIRLLN